MFEILLQAFGFLSIIFAGYFCKKKNYLQKSDGGILSKIIIGITLPATIVVYLAPMEITSLTFYLILIGLFLSIILILIGAFIARKQPPLDRAFMMYCISGYNVGNFTLPFFQGLLPAAIPILCMFDIGNAIMTAGGTTALVDIFSGIQETKPSITKIFSKIFKSIPFMTYLIMIVIRIADLTIPVQALDFFQLFAKGNGFLSLFMVGLYLELRLPKIALSKIVNILAWRYGLGLICAAGFYFFSPFSMLITLTLMILTLCPIPTFTVINSVAIGVPPEEVGFISSVSILISLGLMTSILLFML